MCISLAANEKVHLFIYIYRSLHWTYYTYIFHIFPSYGDTDEAKYILIENENAVANNWQRVFQDGFRLPERCVFFCSFFLVGFFFFCYFMERKYWATFSHSLTNCRTKYALSFILFLGWCLVVAFVVCIRAEHPI